MQRYVGGELVEEHLAGRLSRREMLRQLAAVCGSAGAAAAFLTACGDDSSPPSASPTSSTTTPPAATTSPTPTVPATTTGPTTTSAAAGPALRVATDDPAVVGRDVTFAGPAGTVLAYVARPSAAGSRSGILVVHENRGLTDHIRDVTRRLAKAGYLALAVDLASRAGGTAQAGGGVTAALTNGSPDDRVADLDAGYAYLKGQQDFTGKLGITGFCFGGGVTMLYAGAQPAVLAAVPYYGTPPSPISVLANTNAAFLVHYGATDSRVNATRGDVETALASKVLQVVVHEGAGHAFNNDTSVAYNEAVAIAAWKRTLDWFGTYLKP